VPPTETVRACFHETFGEGSRRTPHDLTPTAHLLDAVMRRTLLPRDGYHEGLTRIQLWLVHHLISQTSFDIWDVILSETEDTLAKGFKGHHQLLYAHWICFLIFMALEPLPAKVMAELTSTTTEFPDYDLPQMMGSSTGSRTPRQQHRQRPEVSETACNTPRC
jgi:hypothetical protein